MDTGGKPCDLWIMERCVELLRAVPAFDVADDYGVVTLNKARMRNISEQPRVNVIFVADTLAEVIPSEDDGGFMSDDDGEDIEIRDLRLQFEISQATSDQALMSEYVAQVREGVMRKHLWVRSETGVRYIVDAGVLAVAPDVETSDDFLLVAMSVQFGYAVLGGSPRQFVL
jgi:hypothetical protein